MSRHRPPRIEIPTITYKEARSQIRVLDGFATSGRRLLQVGIQAARGGVWECSHYAPVTADTLVKSHDGYRVKVLEALGGSVLTENNFSEEWSCIHGGVLWLRNNATLEQRIKALSVVEKAKSEHIPYDYHSTAACLHKPYIVVDHEKYNCSEWGWVLGVKSGLWAPRYNRDGEEIAPVPGDLALWAGVMPIWITF